MIGNSVWSTLLLILGPSLKLNFIFSLEGTGMYNLDCSCFSVWEIKRLRAFFGRLTFWENAKYKAKYCWQDKSGEKDPVLDYNKLKQASNKCDLPGLIIRSMEKYDKLGMFKISSRWIRKSSNFEKRRILNLFISPS